MALYVRFSFWWLARKYRQGIVKAEDLKLLHYTGIPYDDGSVEWFTNEVLESLKKACSDPLTEFVVEDLDE